MFLYIGLLVICLVIYYYVWKPTQYWKEKGVPYVTPMPFVGSLAGSTLHYKCMNDEIRDLYNAFPNEKCSGIFFFSKPNLLVKDLELIKAITIKEFDHFVDHTPQFFKEDLDPLLAKNVFALTGQKWKKMRATLSPAFTGRKMRGMFQFMSECGKELCHYFLEDSKNWPNNIVEVEMRDVLTRYTNDVIATCAFGIKCNSLKDKNNDFYKMGLEITDFKTWRILAIHVLPFILKIFGEGLLSRNIVNYFSGIVMDTIKKRESLGIVRPDMIHLLLEAKKGSLKQEDDVEDKESHFAPSGGESEEKYYEKAELTDEDIIAQAMIFFLAGFENTATAMCFILHELAVNPDIQKRLQDEVDETLEENNGQFTYDGVQKMKYMDMVYSESLRKYTQSPITDRLCTKTFTHTCSDGEEVTIEKGTYVMIPIEGLHKDPKYFPDPYKFDPERFNDENRPNINPLTYMPFGIGPRVCIGFRFAILEGKLAIAHLLKDFNIVVTKKTQVPLKLMKTSTKVTAEKGFHLGLQRRKK